MCRIEIKTEHLFTWMMRTQVHIPSDLEKKETSYQYNIYKCAKIEAI